MIASLMCNYMIISASHFLASRYNCSPSIIFFPFFPLIHNPFVILIDHLFIYLSNAQLMIYSLIILVYPRQLWLICSEIGLFETNTPYITVSHKKYRWNNMGVP